MLNSKPFAYLGFVMGVIFISFGIAIVVNPPEIFAQSPDWQKYGVGVLIVVYGSMRLWRAKGQLKQLEEDKNQNTPTE